MSSAVILRHGPAATPFVIGENGEVVDAEGRTPFHGIISRALLGHARREPDRLPPWAEFGHRLDSSANRNDVGGGLDFWRDAARACGVLRFGQSAAAARSYAERLANAPSAERVLGIKLARGETPTIDLWNVKEGHTSSVWRARFTGEGGAAECAINVARDPEAARELRRTSLVLRLIARDWSKANLARVRQIANVTLPDLADPVLVTCNDWIANALELHLLPGAEDGDVAWIAVERFISSADAPAQICRILGRRLNEVEVTRVEANITEFLARGARFRAQLDVNDGDLVWDGDHAVVVAIR